MKKFIMIKDITNGNVTEDLRLNIDFIKYYCPKCEEKEKENITYIYLKDDNESIEANHSCLEIDVLIQSALET